MFAERESIFSRDSPLIGHPLPIGQTPPKHIRATLKGISRLEEGHGRMGMGGEVWEEGHGKAGGGTC